MSQTYEHLTFEKSDDVTIVRLRADASELDSLDKTMSEMNQLIDEGHHKLIIDLGDVELLQSAGLGAFVAIDKRLASLDGRIRLVKLRPYVAELFEMTGLDSVLEIFANEKAALEGL